MLTGNHSFYWVHIHSLPTRLSTGTIRTISQVWNRWLILQLVLSTDCKETNLYLPWILSTSDGSYPHPRSSVLSCDLSTWISWPLSQSRVSSQDNLLSSTDYATGTPTDVFRFIYGLSCDCLFQCLVVSLRPSLSFRLCTQYIYHKFWCPCLSFSDSEALRIWVEVCHT